MKVIGLNNSHAPSKILRDSHTLKKWFHIPYGPFGNHSRQWTAHGYTPRTYGTSRDAPRGTLVTLGYEPREPRNENNQTKKSAKKRTPLSHNLPPADHGSNWRWNAFWRQIRPLRDVKSRLHKLPTQWGRHAHWRRSPDAETRTEGFGPLLSGKNGRKNNSLSY